MLLGTSGAGLFGNILAGKGIVKTDSGNKKRKRNYKSWLWKRMEFLMPPHPLKNFEIEKYYQNEPRFNGIYSRNNLPKKIKDGAYVINLDEYADVGMHWVALFCNRSEIVYFDSFGVENVPEEITEFVRNKNMTATIFRVQANNSVMRGYFCFVSLILCLLVKNRLILRACFLLMTLKRMTI